MIKHLLCCTQKSNTFVASFYNFVALVLYRMLMPGTHRTQMRGFFFKLDPKDVFSCFRKSQWYRQCSQKVLFNDINLNWKYFHNGQRRFNVVWLPLKTIVNQSGSAGHQPRLAGWLQIHLETNFLFFWGQIFQCVIFNNFNVNLLITHAFLCSAP